MSSDLRLDVNVTAPPCGALSAFNTDTGSGHWRTETQGTLWGSCVGLQASSALGGDLGHQGQTSFFPIRTVKFRERTVSDKRFRADS